MHCIYGHGCSTFDPSEMINRPIRSVLEPCRWFRKAGANHPRRVYIVRHGWLRFRWSGHVREDYTRVTELCTTPSHDVEAGGARSHRSCVFETRIISLHISASSGTHKDWEGEKVQREREEKEEEKQPRQVTVDTRVIREEKKEASHLIIAKRFGGSSKNPGRRMVYVVAVCFDAPLPGCGRRRFPLIQK
ncbi:hypothetical protein BU24DRAFT_283455 [Aaosphaeria arxii CBS 175.79]|uniref:Uncharacterized protein n=1 Tax=Aaosphaeria arxii CBS 175.79 TaxID=1450172 RepID=A0A6A5XF34_9PLEO|nr:uncharacterized protein BU24DRAFT_283455 [Aaosphaeria arxii CBS 175.79]KAF2011543.1 hypothetical protein BU24DRAFT_283455 [Aaosphaeria arxii CBS 175.79]